MEQITLGITPANFISILNTNLNGESTILTSDMTADEYINAINSNFDGFDANYSTSSIDVSIGMTGQAFYNAINANIISLNTVIPNKFSQDFKTVIEEDSVAPTVLVDSVQNAIDNMVKALYDNNLLSKFKAIYPFVGRDLAVAKYNIINPADTDGAYRLTFQNDGATFFVLRGCDGINNGADTHAVMGTDISKTDFHISVFSCENLQGENTIQIGANDGGAYTYLGISNGLNKFYAFSDNSNVSTSDALTDTLGHYGMNVQSGRLRIFKNGIRLKDAAVADGGATPSGSLYAFSRNDGGTVTSPSAMKLGLLTFGNGLTDAEWATFYSIVDDFMTDADRYDTNNLDLLTITSSGDPHSPATESNANLARYKAFKLGGLIHFGMYTFRYNLVSPAYPTLFNLTNINIDKWVSDAKDAGIEYLGFTILDTSGFSLFDNPYNYPDYLLNSVWGYRKFDVALAGADTQIVDKFFTACQKYGIEPMPYVCTVASTAIMVKRTDHGVLSPQNGYDATQKQYYDNWIAKVLQYVMTTWNPRYFWLDIAGLYNTVHTLYDAIKSINSNCIIIGNTIGDRAFTYFPYDIGSNEEYYSLWGDNTWDNVLTTSRVKDGTTYYVPQEIVTNILSGGAGASYYWNNQALRTQGELQTIYNIAKAHSCPFLLSLAPNTSGIIPQSQFDLFKGLTL